MDKKYDYALVEGNLNEIVDFVEHQIENHCALEVAVEPSICLTMVQAEDSVESQQFYLGEVLTTDCEVVLDGKTGYGIVSGDQPVRAYCIAVFDALFKGDNNLKTRAIEFVEHLHEQVKIQEKKEFNNILRTRVDFKLMEQA